MSVLIFLSLFVRALTRSSISGIDCGVGLDSFFFVCVCVHDVLIWTI